MDYGPTKATQRGYERGIRSIAQHILTPRLPGETMEAWLARLQQRANDPQVIQASETLAQRMVVAVNARNQKSWRAAAAATLQSQELHAALLNELKGPVGVRVRQIVRDNARYIRSVPFDAAAVLTGEIAKAQQGGARPETLAKLMHKRFPKLLRSRVNLIARTETSKAATALTQARCEHLNLKWYTWETSGDARTRQSHKNMDGVLVPWDHRPSPEALTGEENYGGYHAGETFNCRCTALVVLSLDDVKFPARVYWNRRIQTMTRQHFLEINGGTALQLEGQR